MTTTAPIEPLQVTIAQAARLLSFNERTIRRMIDAGKLKATGYGTGRRVTMASINAYVNALAESVL